MWQPLCTVDYSGVLREYCLDGVDLLGILVITFSLNKLESSLFQTRFQTKDQNLVSVMRFQSFPSRLPGQSLFSRAVTRFSENDARALTTCEIDREIMLYACFTPI